MSISVGLSKGLLLLDNIPILVTIFCGSQFKLTNLPVSSSSEGKPRRKDLIVLVAHNDDPTGETFFFLFVTTLQILR